MLLALRHCTTLVQTAAELGRIRRGWSLSGGEWDVPAPHPALHRSWFVCRGFPIPYELAPSFSAQPGRCWWLVSQLCPQASFCLLASFECVNAKAGSCLMQDFWQPNLCFGAQKVISKHLFSVVADVIRLHSMSWYHRHPRKALLGGASWQ